MGMSTESSGGPFVEADAAPPVERDADRLNPEPWPHRPLPANVTGRMRQFQVVFRQSVLNDMRAHGESAIDVEVCGVLVGNVYRDSVAPYCQVDANIRGNFASGRNAQVTFTSETWAHINRTMDHQFPDARIVGWYHTHPGFGVFLSEMDLFIQQNFFSQPWQFAYVYDPKSKDGGAFVWRKGSAVREEFLVEDDTRPSPQSPPAAAPVELLVRLRELERQVRRMRGKNFRTRVVAVLWPPLLVAVLFAAGVFSTSQLLKLLPPAMRNHLPVTQPSSP